MSEFRDGDAGNVTLPRTFFLLSGPGSGPEMTLGELGAL